MKNNLVQEFYKFKHQRIPLYGVITLLVLMLYSAFSGTKISKTTIAQGFGVGQWIVLIIITVGSTFFEMEYENNTIVALLYKNSSKVKIYLNKFLVIILYGTALVIIGIVMTFLFKALLVGKQFRWTASYQQTSLLNALLLNLVGIFIYLLFIESLAFLLISWIKNNAAVIGIGLGISFLGASLSSVIMSDFPGLIPLMKWNPFNMIYVMNQLAVPKKFIKISYLTNSQIITCNIIYIIIFMILGYLLFKKRRV
ncbi:MAG: ABC transporter permease [Lentilactobacillus diolivorans]|jgi:ABC-2 type transport system permease protein|nr:ABC transporter permease [Lentilactobacillus diolivorans]RRG04099.1 MAG: ABC transporter permease [Lactobacillus sp.]